MTRRHLRLLPLFIGGPLFVLPMIEEAQPLEKKAEGQRRSTKKTEEKEEEVLNEVWEEQKQEQKLHLQPAGFKTVSERRWQLQEFIDGERHQPGEKRMATRLRHDYASL